MAGATNTGVGAIVAGAFVLLVGLVLWSVCASASSSTAVAASCTGPLVFAVFGVVIILLGGFALVAGRRSYTYVAPHGDPAVPPPLIRPLVVQQTLEREVVEVRCRYCGALSPVDARTCRSCGAPL